MSSCQSGLIKGIQMRTADQQIKLKNVFEINRNKSIGLIGGEKRKQNKTLEREDMGVQLSVRVDRGSPQRKTTPVH